MVFHSFQFFIFIEAAAGNAQFTLTLTTSQLYWLCPTSVRSRVQMSKIGSTLQQTAMTAYPEGKKPLL